MKSTGFQNTASTAQFPDCELDEFSRLTGIVNDSLSDIPNSDGLAG